MADQLLIIGGFSLCFFFACMAGVVLSGFYPIAARPPALKRTGGPQLIGLLVVLAAALAGAALWIGVAYLSWPVVIIAGGLALLFAPCGFEVMPRSFWDSRAGAGAMVLVAGGLLVTLIYINL